ncbi:MAG: lamin tail domain-containing protein [Chitinophagaceae bacterium]
MRFPFTCLLLFFHCMLWSQATRYQVIIDEIMADPSPQVLLVGGLPEAEYVELRNISPLTIDLFNWKLGDATSTATIGVHFLLKPDSFVVICPSAFTQAFTLLGSTIGVSNFPSLDNNHDLITLKSKEGITISAVEYSSEWFTNVVKAQGGWSLEMIDTKSYCVGEGNWTASKDKKGGTPGKANSVNASNPDKEPPRLLRSFATDSLNLTCIFNEPLESSAVLQANYKLSKSGLSILSAQLVDPLFNRITCVLSSPLKPNEIIELTTSNIRDCSGNSIAGNVSVKTGLSVYPDTPALVINEVLFNPVSPGVDYVELLNYGSSIIDLKDVRLANRSPSMVTGSIKTITTESWLLYPGEYCLLTESLEMVTRQFIVRGAAATIQLISLPSFPDEKGTVVITNTNGRIIDELSYDEKWHFKLISNREGIALERISPGKPTRDPSNWHSASGSSGYGTPGYLNSQSGATEAFDGTISIRPRIFSPDNDGIDDFLTLNYQFSEPGSVCNVTVYDLAGKIVRKLAMNLLCGIEGYLRWDGLDLQNRKAGSGIYIIVTDTFTLAGKTRRFKNTVVIGAKG